VVDEMRRGLDHPSCPTGWAEATAFAGKSNQVLVTATIALDSNEAVFEAQVAMELVDDEGGTPQRPARKCPGMSDGPGRSDRPQGGGACQVSEHVVRVPAICQGEWRDAPTGPRKLRAEHQSLAVTKHLRVCSTVWNSPVQPFRSRQLCPGPTLTVLPSSLVTSILPDRTVNTSSTG